MCEVAVDEFSGISDVSDVCSSQKKKKKENENEKYAHIFFFFPLAIRVYCVWKIVLQ